MKIKNLNSSVNSLIGQVKTDNDTIPSVTYEITKDSDNQPAYFINGKYATETIIRTIAPQFIDSIYIVKEDIKIEDKTYNGQIHIKLKKNYISKYISLRDLELKYTSQNNTSTIFMIDNDIIKGDYSKCFVDEKYILNIHIEKIEKKEDNFKANIIRLLTRTDENIKKSKEIRIRGTEEAIIN